MGIYYLMMHQESLFCQKNEAIHRKNFRIFGLICLGLTLLIISIFVTKQVHAEVVDFNMAETMVVDDKAAKSGDIVSLGKKANTLVRAAKAYDDKMYGVLAELPLMVYRTNTSIPVIRLGDTTVNVTTLGGPIIIGDYITSSALAGKGMKASEFNGYVVGIALTPFDGKGLPTKTLGKDKYAEGTIKLSVQVGPASPIIIQAAGGIFGTLKQLFQAIMFNIQSAARTERIVRYILAALVAIMSIYISFRTFGKNITKGLEAIGRNPLAKRSIQAVITLNVILIFVVCLGGLALALIIISI
jgi:hypothetical protein